jgi:hypothetical protein
VVFGSSTTISGQLQSEANAGKTVELQANPYPYTGFVAVATTTTDANGHYSFVRKPPLNTRFRTVVDDLSVTSGVANVGVRIRLGRRASDATPAAGDQVTFSGFACPAHNGAVLALQRRTATGAWETVKRTNLVQGAAGPSCANRSRYRLSIRVFHDRTFRTVAERDADHLRGISRPIAIAVH